jgi:signal transduction histidine kinase
MLEQMGFWQAIEWQLRSLAHRSGIRTFWYVDAAIYLHVFADAAERLLFRFITEAIVNAEKHASASAIQARLFVRNGFVVAIVEDDGVGTSADLLERRGSLGMVGMRERAQAVGGWLEVETAEGSGMAVMLAIPGAFFYEH